MEEIKITRKELYEKVWSTPLTQLAKEYKISDVGLRKKCLKNDIPLPKAGHWAKVKHGKKVKKISLPNPDNKRLITIFIKDDNGRFYDPSEDDRIRIKHEITTQFQEFLLPTVKLTKPHHLISATKTHLSNRQSHYDGHISTDSSQFLNISASKSLLPLALRVFNSFIRLAEARGHSIKINDRSTVIIIDDIDIKIDVRERQKRVIDESFSTNFTYHKNIPSGILCFRMEEFGKREWNNSKKSIEEQLPSIFATLEVAAQQRKRWQIEAEKSRIKREAEEEARRVSHKLKLEEYNKYSQLLSDATRWQQAELIRSYINQAKHISYDQEWARKKADWVDPSTNLEDDILGAYSDKPPSKPGFW